MMRCSLTEYKAIFSSRSNQKSYLKVKLGHFIFLVITQPRHLINKKWSCEQKLYAHSLHVRKFQQVRAFSC